MRCRSHMRVIALSAAIAVGLVLAAAANAAPEAGRGPRREMREPQAPEGPKAQPAHRGGMLFLAREDVDVTVTENDDGVTILVISDKPAMAEKIRAQLPERIERLRQMGPQRRGRPEGVAGRPARRLAAGRFNLLAMDKVAVDVIQKDAGVAIVVTSDDPELAARIKQVLPKQIEAMRHMARAAGELKKAVDAHHPQVAAAREWFRLMLSEDVQIKLTKTDTGVTVSYSSDKPEVAKRIQRMMAHRLEQLEQRRKRVRERGGAGEPRKQRTPERMEQMRKRVRDRGEAPAPARVKKQPRPEREEGKRQAPRGRQRETDAELRKLIREEIRRYVEERER